MPSEVGEENIRIRMSTYCVAFIDLLGQKALYERLAPDLNVSSNDEAVMLEIAKATFGLQRDIKTAFATYSETPRRGYDVLPKELHPIYEKMRNHEVFIQKFSDGIVIFVNLSRSDTHYPLSSLVPALGSIAFAFLGAMNRGYPFRGGIALGKGFQSSPDEIYGPVVANAYDLENTIAQYLRIVIDKNMPAYLSKFFEKDQGSKFVTASLRSMAEYLQRAIATDSDGQLILDYLTFCAMTADENVPLAEELAKGYAFINEQIARFKKSGNDVLLGRYSLLKAYWDSRADILKPFGFVPVAIPPSP